MSRLQNVIDILKEEYKVDDITINDDSISEDYMETDNGYYFDVSYDIIINGKKFNIGGNITEEEDCIVDNNTVIDNFEDLCKALKTNIDDSGFDIRDTLTQGLFEIMYSLQEIIEQNKEEEEESSESD